ncbi:MAG TPA: DUF4129 domain-containing protein, partial [Candidatus Thermoplasmatota archaeon]|nr:DUF4129 domain-containing protein [Candidatus Thermoplasmatota archaeon]
LAHAAGAGQGVPSHRSHSASDTHALRFVFDSTDPNVGDARRDHLVRVVQPTTLTLDAGDGRATVGEALRVAGRLATTDVDLGGGETLPGAGVPGATVRARLGGVDVATTTDADGRFVASLLVPATVPAGEQEVVAAYAGDDDHDAAERGAGVVVRRTAEILDLPRLEGPRSVNVTLSGRLVDNEGKGFIGLVTAQGPGGATVGSARSDREGRFAMSVALRELGLGASAIRVSFAGDALHAPGANVTTARVTTATRMVVDEAPASVVRGDAFTVRARLLDDRGAPVPAVAVKLLWRGARVADVVTGPTGELSAVVRTNATDRPAPSVVAFSYEPASSSSYRGSSAGETVALKAGSRLDAAAQNVTRGPVRVAGTLAGDDGLPLGAATVTVMIGDAPPVQVQTARNGSFEAVRVLPPDAPLAPLPVRVSYAGTASIAGANATPAYRVQSPLVLELTAVGPFVRGEDATIAGRMLQDNGKPFPAVVKATLAGADLGTATGDLRTGAFSARVKVPATLARGPATLTLVSPATDEHPAYEKTIDVIVKIRPKVDVKMPAVAVRGFSFSADLTLQDDKGQPLRNTTFAFAVGKGTSAVFGRTDADGKATLPATAPLTGDATLALTVRGGDDVVAASATAAGVRVVGPATPVGYAALVLVALAVVALVALAVVATVLRRRQLVEARQILDDAIRELLAGNEYAGTVFLAYRRFVAHLGRHGFAEKASDTPREFALGVRKAVPVGAAPLRELIRLFEEARYSDHPIGSEERDRAVESLARVRNEIDAILGKRAAAPGGT